MIKAASNFRPSAQGRTMAIAPQIDSPPVGTLITSRETIHPTMRIAEVADRFFAVRELEALALVEDGRPCGLATRSKIFSILFRHFGFELYGRFPITEIADRQPLTVGEEERLDLVLDRAMRRDFEDIYDEIVVVDGEGRFKGLLSVKRLVVEQGNVLAQSLAQREMALAKAREMKKVTDLKSQFIAHVTHELRSPVNAIIGLSELMKLGLERGQVEQSREKLALLASSAVNLRAIITNILDHSKMEAGKMEVVAETFDLAALLREVAETTRVLLGDKPVAIEVESAEEPFPFESDSIKVRQVLVNLTSNAAKFTEQGEIRLALERQEAGIRLAVSDTGVGIREADLEKLFTAFSQLEDAKTRRHEGTGLGLTITRQMVGLLGGRIQVDSTYGRGTTFAVLLPAAIPQQERAANE
jgi:signal transduction histidine kinase